MLITVMRSKIHRAVVTETHLEYDGSITIDENLLDKSGMYENEKVQVVNLNNGSRLETYIIKGEKGSGIICLNGPAARKVARLSYSVWILPLAVFIYSVATMPAIPGASVVKIAILAVVRGLISSFIPALASIFFIPVKKRNRRK